MFKRIVYSSSVVVMLFGSSLLAASSDSSIEVLKDIINSSLKNTTINSNEIERLKAKVYNLQVAVANLSKNIGSNSSNMKEGDQYILSEIKKMKLAIKYLNNETQKLVAQKNYGPKITVNRPPEVSSKIISIDHKTNAKHMPKKVSHNGLSGLNYSPSKTEYAINDPFKSVNSAEVEETTHKNENVENLFVNVFNDSDKKVESLEKSGGNKKFVKRVVPNHIVETPSSSQIKDEVSMPATEAYDEVNPEAVETDVTDDNVDSASMAYNINNIVPSRIHRHRYIIMTKNPVFKLSPHENAPKYPIPVHHYKGEEVVTNLISDNGWLHLSSGGWIEGYYLKLVE